VEKDADVKSKTGKAFSNLIVFPKPLSQIEIISGNFSGELKLHLLQVPYIKFDKAAYKQNFRSKKGCEKPVTVDQDIWRAGLTPPSVAPTPNQVTHIIVHHTATPNTDSNYVNVVRNIYLYHTQVNGWDDIGYNFLVAPDGTIFQGRDGMGMIEDDDVKGAHFCNKNTNTMGISMIGDYQTIQPTDTSLRALEQLIAWKMNKLDLDPRDSALHNGEMLNRISGHRDGCSTECPGDSVYVRLPEIRNAVETLMQDCITTVGIDSKHFLVDVYMAYHQENQLITIDNLQAGNYNYAVIDMQGKVRLNGETSSNQNISVSDLPKGIYIVQLYNTSGKNTLKFVKL
jgi:hypothetical protein